MNIGRVAREKTLFLIGAPEARVRAIFTLAGPDFPAQTARFPANDPRRIASTLYPELPGPHMQRAV